MKKLFLLMIIVIFLFSCKKEYIELVDNKSTIDLVANSDFDWRTSKDITLKINGMEDVNPNISNVLYVTSINNDAVYYKELLYLNKDYTINFKVPSTVSGVNLSYGVIKQQKELNSDVIEFNYID